MKAKKDYLIRAMIVIEIDYLALFRIIINYKIPDISILRWISYIKLFYTQFRHVASNEYSIRDVIFCALFNSKDAMIQDTDDVDTQILINLTIQEARSVILRTKL